MSEQKSTNPFQRTNQWFADRCGCLTASRAAKALAVGKNGKFLKSRQDMIDTIIAERMTGIPESTPTTAAMQWGVDHEADARAAYEDLTGNLVELCGFVPHHGVDFFGASPDGLVGSDGLVEIKCPNTVTHLRRLATREIPLDYRIQMQVQMLCTGRSWCDYVDWDGRLAEKHPGLVSLVIRYAPTEEELAETYKLCREFLAEVDKQFNVLTEREN